MIFICTVAAILIGVPFILFLGLGIRIYLAGERATRRVRELARAYNAMTPQQQREHNLRGGDLFEPEY